MLDVIALDIAAEPAAEINNALGTTMPKHYHHLYDKAGEKSRASSIRRGVTTMWSHPYPAHVAEKSKRLSDMVSRSAERLVQSTQDAKQRVRSVLHTQATLDQQIVGSACLRLEEEAFPNSCEAATIGQCGTAGFGTALALSPLLLSEQTHESQDLVAITAGDKWIAPFHRKLGCFRFGDAAGSMLVGHNETQAIGRIECVETRISKPLSDIWTTDEAASSDYIFEHALSVCRAAMKSSEMDGRDIQLPDYICGDVTTSDVGRKLAQKLGLISLQAEYSADGSSNDDQDVLLNTSSASPLAAMSACLERATTLGQNVRALIWSASPSGNAAAFIFTALPSHQTEQGVWI